MGNRGGARIGAGRPKGQGKYKESTKAIRVPESMLQSIQHFIEKKPQKIPLYACTVKAGFPSPAEDYIDDYLDLNEHLIKHPAATFMVRASGDSMINAGIFPNTLLVVDKSLAAAHGNIVIAAIDNELTVKRLSMKGEKIQLLPENDHYAAIDITDSIETVIWGVVTSIIQEVG